MLSALLLLAAAPDAPLRIATYAYPRYDRTQALVPMKELIAGKLQRSATVTLYPSPDALRDAVLAGQVDVAMTNLSAFLGMAGDPAVEAIAVLDVPGATLDQYRGVLLARGELGLDGPALAARASALRYVEVLPGSTSGALVQADHLRRSGVARTAFGTIRQAGTHDAALAALLSGEGDVAALAEEPWRKLKAERPDEAAKLVELWRSEPLPPGPVICVRSTATPCGRIGALLRSEAGKATAEALAAGWAETIGARAFRAVRADDYRSFRPAAID